MHIADESLDRWHGYRRHKFQIDGHDAWIVEPETPASGTPWSWCLEWPEAFVERCATLELLARGFHHVHVNIFGTYASPEGIKVLNQFYEKLQGLGFAKRAALIGLSLGGLYSYRWASENPAKVAVIYADAPVCDFKAWPRGSSLWEKFKTAYGFTDEQLTNYKGGPVDALAPLAAAQIPVIHVVGLSDDVVPVSTNTDLLEARYKQLGGTIKVLRRPYVGHHPHGYDDQTPVVDFILEHCDPR